LTILFLATCIKTTPLKRNESEREFTLHAALEHGDHLDQWRSGRQNNNHRFKCELRQPLTFTITPVSGYTLSSLTDNGTTVTATAAATLIRSLLTPKTMRGSN
jgi:hypothetical protein